MTMVYLKYPQKEHFYFFFIYFYLSEQVNDLPRARRAVAFDSFLSSLKFKCAEMLYRLSLNQR